MDAPGRPPNIEDVAVELYQLTPAEFTAARNARVKAITATGDKQLAAVVRALLRPAASAWVLNRLTAEDNQTRADFARLGTELRAAQQQPVRQTLSGLAAERRALVGRAAEAAERLARENGVALSAAAVIEVQQTLNAALADEAAAAAVFSGRLIRPLQSIGLDEVDLEGAVGGPEVVPVPALSNSQTENAPRSASRSAAGEREEARRAAAAATAEEAANAAAEAETAADQAEQRQYDAESALSRHDTEAEDLSEHIVQLQAELADLRHQHDELEHDRAHLDAEAAGAAESARESRKKAGAARARADRLRRRD